MNNLEKKTYIDYVILLDEFINENMTEEEKEIIRKKTTDMYKDFTDDDWRDLGDNY